jgi:hypothetical protein
VILAQFLDDCWEPAEAAHLLRRLARGSPGAPCCLRVAADGARLVGDDFAAEEPPGAATYLWALWQGSPPTLGELVALHEEHVRVVGLRARLRAPERHLGDLGEGADADRGAPEAASVESGGVGGPHCAGSTMPRRSRSEPSIR